MIIACTSRFHKDLSLLTKKVKDGYSNCLFNILSVFGDLPVSDISLMGDTLNRDIIPPGTQYRKIRIPSSEHSGKSGGYRLFCLCFVIPEAIVLLHVYPKTGRLAGVSPNHKDYVIFIEEMESENGHFFILNKDKMEFEKHPPEE